jgi:hypothetical protein
MTVTLQLAAVLGFFAMTLGPILGLMLLLNARDRRQDRLLGLMLDLTPRDLQDRISIEIRSSAFSRRSVAAVDMCPCSREEMWRAIGRWSANLPPAVRLQVNGRVDQGVPARLTVETARRGAPCCPPTPSVAAG